MYLEERCRPPIQHPVALAPKRATAQNHGGCIATGADAKDLDELVGVQVDDLDADLQQQAGVVCKETQNVKQDRALTNPGSMNYTSPSMVPSNQSDAELSTQQAK